MTLPAIFTGITAAGGTLYAAVDRQSGGMGAIGHSEATARLAPYRDLRVAVEQMTTLGALVTPWKSTE